MRAAWIIAATVYGLALGLRLGVLDQASVDSDSLGQFLAAWSVSWDHLPAPPNPEGGHALWWMAWPLVQVADSLEGLFALRFAVGALVAPLGALAAAWLAPEGRSRWVAATLAGAVLAVDPGLRDTLVSAFRGYGAPELAAVATVCVVAGLRGAAWAPAAAGLSALAAAGQHPMAAGLALGLLAVAPALVRATSRRAVALGAAATALAAVPRAAWVLELARCGEGVERCIGRVARGSSEPLGSGELLVRALQDRVAGELGLVGVCAALAVVGVSVLGGGRRNTPAGAPLWGAVLWALGAGLGVVLVGLSVSSLRPYHLRIVAAPLAVATAAGLATRPWAALGLAGAAVLTWSTSPVVGLTTGAVARADAGAAALLALEGPLRVDGVWLSGAAPCEASGLVLAALLQGAPPERFTPSRDATQVLCIAGGAETPLSGTPVAGLPPWQLRALPHHRAARRWLRESGAAPLAVGGAWDWAVAIDPVGADLAVAEW